MLNLLKKYFILIQNVFFSILILPLLLAFTIVNTENIYQFNINDIYVIIYFVYLLLGIILIYLSKYIHNLKYRVLKDELLYTIKFIFFFSIFLIPSFYIIHNFIFEHVNSTNLYLRGYGRVAFLYMALSLSITPILTFIKKKKIRDNLILSRKILGIISFIYFFKHGLEYFSLEYIFQAKYHPNITYLEYVYKNLPDRYDAVTGIIAGVLMLVLGLTSNKISMKFFGGKLWKTIQSIVYPAFLLSIIHIAYSGRIDNFYITMLLTVVALRTLSYIVDSDKKTTGPTTKYICIPCGFIYDENKGDPDGGLEPGTKFKDIPDGRRCPVCGVSKADFEPYYEGTNTVFGGFLGDIVGYKMLTHDVLQLTLKPNSKLNVNPGQYASIILKDFDGEFTRSYSISEKKGDDLRFTIKLKQDGRGGRQLKKYKIGDTLKIKGIYGDFILQNTPNPKVFIATGTGLAPVYHMMIKNSFSKNNQVFFGLQKKEDIFYEEKLKNIKDLEINIFLSREEIKGYKSGRMDLSKIKFNKNTEFYLCGSPGLVQATSDNLKERGYENVYSEKFN